MRISKEQVQVFIKCIESFGVHHFELYLFGSRAKDNKKGGDIDLIVIASNEYIQRLQSIKPLLLAKIKLQSSDEKTDFTFLSEDKKSTDVFFNSIPTDELIRLK
jgi:predicted nucleotidyltransferase